MKESSLFVHTYVPTRDRSTISTRNAFSTAVDFIRSSDYPTELSHDWEIDADHVVLLFVTSVPVTCRPIPHAIQNSHDFEFLPRLDLIDKVKR